MKRGILADAERAALIERITRQLSELDDRTLLALEHLGSEAALNADKIELAGRPVSRRRFLTATLASGLVAASAGAVAVWQYGSGRSQELTDDLMRVNENLSQVWGLVRLYEKLDESDMEQAVLAGLAAVGAAFETMNSALQLVKTGAQAIEDALTKVEAALPAIRANITWLESLLSDLTQRLRLLEDALGRALDEVSPITQALGAFFNSIIGLMPLGGAQRVREVLDRTGELVSLIPRAIADLSVKLLTPLRDEWFAEGSGKGLQVKLVDPINTLLISPAKALPDKWSAMLSQWETDLRAPAKAALARREAARKEIADYKAQYRLQPPSNENKV